MQSSNCFDNYPRDQIPSGLKKQGHKYSPTKKIRLDKDIATKKSNKSIPLKATEAKKLKLVEKVKKIEKAKKKLKFDKKSLKKVEKVEKAKKTLKFAKKSLKIRRPKWLKYSKKDKKKIKNSILNSKEDSVGSILCPFCVNPRKYKSQDSLEVHCRMFHDKRKAQVEIALKAISRNILKKPVFAKKKRGRPISSIANSDENPDDSTRIPCPFCTHTYKNEDTVFAHSRKEHKKSAGEVKIARCVCFQIRCQKLQFLVTNILTLILFYNYKIWYFSRKKSQQILKKMVIVTKKCY